MLFSTNIRRNLVFQNTLNRQCIIAKINFWFILDLDPFINIIAVNQGHIAEAITEFAIAARKLFNDFIISSDANS